MEPVLEFVIVCGQRRIGKAFLVDRFFRNEYDFTFVSGHKAKTTTQLRNFAKAVRFYSGKNTSLFSDWYDMLSMRSTPVLYRQNAVEPFTLGETEEYFKSQDFYWTRFDMLQCYMLTGGVPYYPSLLDSKLSIAQNIDLLCFDEKGPLRKEFSALLYQHKSGLEYWFGYSFVATKISSRGTPDSRTPCPTSSSLSYMCAVSILRKPAASAAFTELTQTSPCRL